MSFRHLVLGLLNQRPMSGYDIKRFLKSLGWMVDTPSFGTIYSSLHSLHHDGLVTVKVVPNQDKPPRKIYSLTEAGREALREWSEQPITLSPSLKTFVMRLILAGDFTQARLIGFLQQRRDWVATHHAALRQDAETLDGDTESQQMVLDFGLVLASTELAWLDSTLNRLSKQRLLVEVANGN